MVLLLFGWGVFPSGSIPKTQNPGSKTQDLGGSGTKPNWMLMANKIVPPITARLDGTDSITWQYDKVWI